MRDLPILTCKCKKLAVWSDYFPLFSQFSWCFLFSRFTQPRFSRFIEEGNARISSPPPPSIHEFEFRGETRDFGWEFAFLLGAAPSLASFAWADNFLSPLSFCCAAAADFPDHRKEGLLVPFHSKVTKCALGLFKTCQVFFKVPVQCNLASCQSGKERFPKWAYFIMFRQWGLLVRGYAAVYATWYYQM